jgi:hypothetical protein
MHTTVTNGWNQRENTDSGKTFHSHKEVFFHPLTNHVQNHFILVSCILFRQAKIELTVMLLFDPDQKINVNVQ